MTWEELKAKWDLTPDASQPGWWDCARLDISIEPYDDPDTSEVWEPGDDWEADEEDDENDPLMRSITTFVDDLVGGKETLADSAEAYAKSLSEEFDIDKSKATAFVLESTVGDRDPNSLIIDPTTAVCYLVYTGHGVRTVKTVAHLNSLFTWWEASHAKQS